MSLPKCQLCDFQSSSLFHHILQKHEMSLEEYLHRFPKAPTILDGLLKESLKVTRRAHPISVEKLQVQLYNIPFDYHAEVPSHIAAPMPAEYRLPTTGEAYHSCLRATIGLWDGASQFIWGASGIGKDAFLMYWSAKTRTPYLSIQLNPDVDISKTLWSHEIGVEGTYYQEGQLLKALRDGYLSKTGKRIPYLIVFTDLDRSTPQQTEHLRLILDSVSGRIQGPDGQTATILEGTKIMATANSIGVGDFSGRYASVQLVDASILSRFDYKIQFHLLDWVDESVILQAKFPLLTELYGKSEIAGRPFFEHLGSLVEVIRKAISDGVIELEFGHREIVAILRYATSLCRLDLMQQRSIRKKLLAEAVMIVIHSLQSELQSALTLLINPYIRGGLIATGDISHIKSKVLEDDE